MNGRYLREPTGRSRREAVVTDRVRGRRSRAENARTRVALGRTGVSEKAVVPTNREIRFPALLTETTAQRSLLPNLAGSRFRARTSRRVHASKEARRARGFRPRRH